MVDQLPSYLFAKRDVYYYSRRIPPKMWAIYGKKRLVISLGTTSYNEGLSLSHALTQKLDAQWLSHAPADTVLDVLSRKLEPQKRVPTLSEACETYLKIKGSTKPKSRYFHRYPVTEHTDN